MSMHSSDYIGLVIQNIPAIIAGISGIAGMVSLYLHKQKPTATQVESIANSVVNKVVIPTSLVKNITGSILTDSSSIQTTPLSSVIPNSVQEALSVNSTTPETNSISE